MEAHGIKPTAVRQLVWQQAQKMRTTFSLSDMEEAMPSMDRSSIFRALRLFAEHHMLHEIDDGSGHRKYCVCHCHDEKHVQHLHFTCLHCGRTYCIHDVPVPQVPIPTGFSAQESEFIIKGTCAACASKQDHR
ncbi:MAG: transcriptional repressor [Bacteroidaceae bacterium]|nr:transcriptional repressor [Bacteroidaceae bacterium]